MLDIFREMVCHAALTLANSGACFFIDAINPDGTLCPDVYDRLGRVNAAVRPFKEKIQSARPTLIGDIGLYFSMPSHADFKDNGIDLFHASSGASNMQSSTEIQTIREILGTSIILGKANTPYRIVTSDKPDFSGLRALIVNNAAFMSPEEVSAIREFVRDGGTLIATAYTSLYNIDGNTSGDFQLSDVFGVSFSGEMSERVNYLTYSGHMDALPKESESGERQFIVADTASPLVTSTGARILAQVSETYFTPGNAEHYASIHSNPPGPATDYAGLTVNSFGRGKCVYLYSSLFALQNESHQAFGKELFDVYASSDLLVSCDAPSCVEVTVLQSATEGRLFLCFVNYQSEFPNVPVHNLSASLRLPNSKQPVECMKVSDGQLINYDWTNGIFSACVPLLQNFEIVEIVFG